MRRKSAISLVAMAALLLAAAMLMPVRHASAAAYDSRWGANYFPNVTLITQDGTAVHFYDDLLKGKIVVIDLIYTHCVDSCPLETARLAQVQKMLGDRVGKDIFFYSITIDPKRDTPEVLKDYAEKYHVGPGWTFLTGKAADIELISKKLGMYSDPDPNNRDGHAPVVLLGNEATGQWMQDTATDNPRFMANLISNWLNNWKTAEAPKSYANMPQLDISDRGRYLFGTQCAACHSIGHGDKIGPDLLGVTNVRGREWLKRIIQIPDKMVAEGDPVATALFKQYRQLQMPNLRVSDEEAALLIKFLEKQTGTPQTSTGQPAKADVAQSSIEKTPADVITHH